MTNTFEIQTFDDLIKKVGNKFEVVVRNEKNKRFK